MMLGLMRTIEIAIKEYPFASAAQQGSHQEKPPETVPAVMPGHGLIFVMESFRLRWEVH